jgi:hypothetical protein
MTHNIRQSTKMGKHKTEILSIVVVAVAAALAGWLADLVCSPASD